MPAPYLQKMIEHLRTHEEVVLLGYTLPETDAEKERLLSFLSHEYKNECLSYPFTAPPFDAEGAYWAAKLIYAAAQLILYRQNKEKDLAQLLPAEPAPVSPAAILSADLCLRFLPDMIFQLKMIDSQDTLVPLLEGIISRWHYSGINMVEETDQLDFSVITSDKCLHQLYAERVITAKKMKLALHPACNNLVKAALGNLGSHYWPNFITETTIDEQHR